MTEGEFRVGTTFNPSGNAKVDQVKKATAELIDLLQEIVEDRAHPGARAAAVACTEYETAAMWAVKAITKQPKSE